MALQLHINVSLNRLLDRTWRRPQNKWLDQLRNDSTLQIGDHCRRVVTVDIMVVQRRDGHDDDYLH